MKFLIVESYPLPILTPLGVKYSPQDPVLALCDVSEHPCFYSVRLLASRQTPKLEDHYWTVGK